MGSGGNCGVILEGITSDFVSVGSNRSGNKLLNSMFSFISRLGLHVCVLHACMAQIYLYITQVNNGLRSYFNQFQL